MCFCPQESQLTRPTLSPEGLALLVDTIHLFWDVDPFYFGSTFSSIFPGTDENNVIIFSADIAFDSKNNT